MIYILFFGLLLGTLMFIPCSRGNKKIDYNHYQVLRLQPSTYSQRMWVKLLRNNTDLDFWSPTDVMVQKHQVEGLKKIINEAGIQWSPLITDVQKVVSEETEKQKIKYNVHMKGMIFDKYHHYDDILLYLKLLNKRYPKVTTLDNLANTTSERMIPILKISTRGDETRNVITIMGGLKGRDWLSVAMSIFTIQQLVENPVQAYLLRSVDWHIIPVLNPDGYEYSFNTDRLAYKNAPGNTFTCVGRQTGGVDLDRNFPFNWKGYGTSFWDSCQPNFGGSRPFSEPESKGLGQYIRHNRGRIKVFLSLYSQGHYIVYPWSSLRQEVWNSRYLERLARRANAAQESQTGQRYRVGPALKVLYRSSGSVEDWMMGVAKIPYCFRVGLPGGGANGYDVPNHYINRTLRDFFPAIRTFGGEIASPRHKRVSRAGSDRAPPTSLDVGIFCAVFIICRTSF